MSDTPRPAMFATANPHALATILEASHTKSIIASRDIFDVSGTKLWARDQPVSQALQRKLLDRQLRHPLESCLYAEDGVTSRSLWGRRPWPGAATANCSRRFTPGPTGKGRRG